MYDAIRQRLDERIRAEARLRIDRVPARDEDEQRDIALISEHVTASLKKRMSEMFDDADAAEAAAQPAQVASEFGGLLTERQLAKHFEQQVVMDLGVPIRTLELTVPNGSSIHGLPYDRDWSTGNGVAIFARADGKVYTIPSDDGFSAAGVSFYLTTNEPVLAAITPQGDYNWNWAAFTNLPFVRSSGGLGITVYTDGAPEPTLNRQPVLWSISGPAQFAGDKGSGRIADAASPAFGLGTLPLAPALLNMNPGSTYQVWVWCWQTSQSTKNTGFWAYLSFFMPFVTIEAGPQLSIH